MGFQFLSLWKDKPVKDRPKVIELFFEKDDVGKPVPG